MDVSQAKKFHNTLSPLVMFRWTEWECWKLLLLSFVELEQTGRGAGGGCKRSGVDVVPTHTHTHSCTWPWAVFAHLTRWLSEPRVNGDFVSGSVTSCTAVICQWWRLDYYREYKRWGPLWHHPVVMEVSLESLQLSPSCRQLDGSECETHQHCTLIG